MSEYVLNIKLSVCTIPTIAIVDHIKKKNSKNEGIQVRRYRPGY